MAEGAPLALLACLLRSSRAVGTLREAGWLPASGVVLSHLYTAQSHAQA